MEKVHRQAENNKVRLNIQADAVANVGLGLSLYFEFSAYAIEYLISLVFN